MRRSRKCKLARKTRNRRSDTKQTFFEKQIEAYDIYKTYIDEGIKF